MRVLILEDSKFRQKVFRHNLIGVIPTFVETAAECIDILNSQERFSILFLDHDLGGQEMQTGQATGTEVAQWLHDNPNKLPVHIIIHSLNPVGANRMMDLLPNATYSPGCWEKIDVRNGSVHISQ